MASKVQPDRPSLTVFAADDKVNNGPACWLCGLPERKEIETAFDSGKVTMAAAARWLKQACGYKDATVHRLGNHLKNHARAS